MSYFGFNNNNETLLHNLIAKVDLLTKLVIEDDNEVLDPESLTMPKNFKELRAVVLHLAQNDIERLDDSKEWADIIVAQSKDINNLKMKMEIINAKSDL